MKKSIFLLKRLPDYFQTTYFQKAIPFFKSKHSPKGIGGLLILLLLISFGINFNCKKDDSNKSNSKFKIAGIVFQEDQFFKLVQMGMRDAALKNGVELLEGNSYNKPDKEIQLVNTYISSKVDAIVIAPLSATASMAALKRANEKGLKIIIHNNIIENDAISAAIESDQKSLGIETGKAAAKYITEKLNGKAKIAILAFMSQLPEQSNARAMGFKEEVLKLPGVQILAEQDAWLPEMAIKKAGDIMTSNPDVNLIWSANEGGTVGSVMAVKNSGKAGKVVVFGTDISNQLIDFLLADENILQAVTGQQAHEIGYQALELAIKVLKNEQFNKKTYMPGALLSRENRNSILEYQKKYNELISKESK